MSNTRRTSSRAAAKAASVYIENILTPRKTRSTKVTELSISEPPPKFNINSPDKTSKKNTEGDLQSVEDLMKKSSPKKSSKNKMPIAVKETVEPSKETIEKDSVKKSKKRPTSKSEKGSIENEVDKSTGGELASAAEPKIEKKARRKSEKSETVEKDSTKEDKLKKLAEKPEKDKKMERKAEKKLEQKADKQKMEKEQNVEKSDEKKENDNKKKTEKSNEKVEKGNERKVERSNQKEKGNNNEKKVETKKGKKEKKDIKKLNKKAESPKVIKDTSTNSQKEQTNSDEEQRKLDSDIIQGFDSSEGEDSSDEEEDPFKAGIPAIALDPNDKARLKKKIQDLETGGKLTPGVVYLGRIPHGFYEEEMKAYFSQFGTVTKLRLSRNKKTGRSKHYAFIEFASDEVARIVAETMNDYLLFGHLLKCKVIPESELHSQMWKGANSTFKAIPWKKISRDMHNKPMTEERRKNIVSNLLRKESKKRKRLEEMGVDYEFTGYAGAEMEELKKVKKAKI